jgi:hypothetical protein
MSKQFRGDNSSVCVRDLKTGKIKREKRWMARDLCEVENAKFEYCSHSAWREQKKTEPKVKKEAKTETHEKQLTVVLQLTDLEDLPKDRKELKNLVRDTFKDALKGLSSVKFSLKSLNPTNQTMEADLPESELVALKAELEKRGLKVNLLEDK